MPFTSGAHTLYRFWDADGRLLYVGITYLGTARWFYHARAKSWWTDVTTVTLQHFATRAESYDAELQAILSENPVYNVRRRRPIPPRRDKANRRAGTGSVFQRKSGDWIALLPATMGRRSKWFHSEADATHWLDTTLAAQSWT